MLEVSIFGKLPTQADFLRHGISSEPLRQVETWLLESSQMLLGAGLDFPQTAVHFVFARPEWPQVILAIAVKSTDAVSRKFPLVAFTAIDASLVGGRGWLLPLVGARFLKEALTSLMKAAAGGGPQFGDLEGLPRIDAAVFQQAEDVFHQAITNQTVQSFESRVFKPKDGRYYAYRTLKVACDSVRRSAPSQAETMLGCPIVTDVDLVVWASMVAKLTRWPAPAPMMWLKQPTPSLLVCLGHPPLRALRFMVDETTDSKRFWPLITHHSEAIAAARQELQSITNWDQQGEPLDGLIDRVATLQS